MSNDIKVGEFIFSAPVQIHKFCFEQVGKCDGKPKKIIQNIGAVALQDDNAYTVQLEVDLQIGEDDDKLFVVKSILYCAIEFLSSNKENEKYLNNAVVILYSYLRPLIAQMTTMAKLPPLDLQPLNFENIKIKIERKEKNATKKRDKK